MIPFASQRGGGQDLATHLLNNYDNEIAELDQLRGAIAPDLHGAFREWQIQAETLTRCQKYLYSLSVNPDPAQGPLSREQYMDYISRVEHALGLAQQPRAIVFHIKYGREHCHIVWSRIDVSNGKAVHLAFDHDTLMRVTRQFARDHGLKLPAGYEKSRQAGQISLYEQEQYRQTGLSKDDHIHAVTEAWRHADGAHAFVRALSERGYILATGKRPYVLVDLYGGSHALPKLIADKSVRTKDVAAFLENDYPVSALPSVEEAEGLAARHRALIERAVTVESYAAALAALRHQQAARRAMTMEAGQEGRRAFVQQADALAQNQRRERLVLRAAHHEQDRAIRAARRKTQPAGLAAFLGRVTGMTQVIRAWRRYRDARRRDRYRAEVRALCSEHEVQRLHLADQELLRLREAERQMAALRRVDRRELTAFLRDQKSEQRILDRGGAERMPELPTIFQPGLARRNPPVDVLSSFEKAKERRWLRLPEVGPDFDRATRPPSEDGGGEAKTISPTIKPSR